MSVVFEPREPLAAERFEIRTLIGELVDTVGPVESRPGHGSSFFVHLPATAVDGGVAAADRFVESTPPGAVRRASA